MGDVTDSGRRVVLIDDDLWVRTGYATCLNRVSEIEVIADLGFAEALEWSSEWDDVDVAVVDAYERRAGFDHFAGAEVVEVIRARRSSEETVVVVVSGRSSDCHLRLRMAEVGADFLYGYDEVDDPAVLASVILDPDEQRRAAVGQAWGMAAQGLSSASRPQRFLRWLGDQGLKDAFCPGVPQTTTGLSRRRIMAVRAAAARIGGLSPALGLGGGPQQKGSDPTWREVVDFVNRARGHSEE